MLNMERSSATRLKVLMELSREGHKYVKQLKFQVCIVIVT